MSFRPALIVLALLLTSGCATVDTAPDERDPLESFNRAMYRFNDGFDRAILRPTAEAYQKVTPEAVNRGITNFFSNLGDVIVILNDLLQFKFAQAGSDLGRLTFNSTVGLLGFIDVATPMNFRKHNEDFGQTLGYWGFGTGPYLVLPFFGPSDFRDGIGLAADWQADLVYEIPERNTRWGTVALRAVDTRANLLRATRLLEQAALDPYIFLRDAYLQRRENLVYDGNPPPPKFEDFEEPAPKP